MARKSKPKPPQEPPAKNFEEFAEDAEVVDEEVVNVEPEGVAASSKMRDWRDVEKYKEMRELRRLVDDDFDIDDLLDDKPRRR